MDKQKLFSHKRILAVVFVAVILVAATAVFAAQPKPEEQVIGPNGAVYTALVPAVEDLGYQVSETRQAGGATEDGEPITEYRYLVKDGAETVGSLSFGICKKGIAWQMGDQAFAALKEYTGSDWFLLQNDTLYLPDGFICDLLAD